jgi:phage-related protein
MAHVGPGVIEIRLHTRGEHRVFYVAKFHEVVYVIHAFESGLARRPGRTSHWPRSAWPI